MTEEPTAREPFADDRQRAYLQTVEHLYEGNPDIRWLVARARAGLAVASFLDSFKDDSELVERWPSLGGVMRRYAKALRGEADL